MTCITSIVYQNKHPELANYTIFKIRSMESFTQAQAYWKPLILLPNKKEKRYISIQIIVVK